MQRSGRLVITSLASAPSRARAGMTNGMASRSNGPAVIGPTHAANVRSKRRDDCRQLAHPVGALKKACRGWRACESDALDLAGRDLLDETL